LNVASVGQYAIQLAAWQGVKVVTTCSPKNFDLVKKLGASHAFSYRDKDVVDQISKAAPDLTYVFDTIGNKDSSATAASAVSGQGKLCTVRPGKANTDNVPKNVEVSDVLVWTAFLKEHTYGQFHWPVRA
jgi:NADPH:quinone reductase-like Zn-dependent oxidoreductase